MAEPASTLAVGPGGPAGTAGPADSAGTAGTVETRYLDLPEPVRLDCGRYLHPVRVAYETYGALSPRRDNVILVCHALSGDAKSLIIHPASTTHRQLGDDELRAAGVGPGTVRLSVGTESVEDLIWDLEQGFALVAARRAGNSAGKEAATA